MDIPKLTHQQTLVVSILSEDGECWGRDLRDSLANHGWSSSLPAFYQMMSRLEEAGLVQGHVETKVISGQTLKQRKYRVTPKGGRALEAAVEFYVQAGRAAGVLLT